MERFKGERRQDVEECKAPVIGLRAVETKHRKETTVLVRMRSFKIHK